MAASTDPLHAARSAAGLTGKGRMKESEIGVTGTEEYRSPISHEAATGTASTSTTAPASTSHLTPASCRPTTPAAACPAAWAGPALPTARAAATPAPVPASWSAITATSSRGTYHQRRPGAIFVRYVTDHHLRVPALGVQVGVGIALYHVPQPVLLVQIGRARRAVPQMRLHPRVLGMARRRRGRWRWPSARRDGCSTAASVKPVDAHTPGGGVRWYRAIRSGSQSGWPRRAGPVMRPETSGPPRWPPVTDRALCGGLFVPGLTRLA